MTLLSLVCSIIIVFLPKNNLSKSICRLYIFDMNPTISIYFNRVQKNNSILSIKIMILTVTIFYEIYHII